MLTKRTVIVALVGVNLALLAALVFSSFTPPAAWAQAPGRAGDFTAITCQVHQDFDALYVLDGPANILQCFVPTRARNGTIAPVQPRNLVGDFTRSN